MEEIKERDAIKTRTDDYMCASSCVLERASKWERERERVEEGVRAR